MRRAIEHARRGLGRTTPNPVVGACVVSDEGVVLGDGAHERAGEAHAEVHALDEAGAAACGATLYCTLEPCSHTGRTGPCVERIMAAGIRRVVAAMEDPFPLVSGRGFAILRAHGIDVAVGVEHEAAIRLNQPYLTTVRCRRPFVVVKAATSLDGCIAARPGVRTWLTSPVAWRHAQAVRAQVDAVAVGSETVLVDDPFLTAREVYRERPLTRVVFDRRLRTPPGARLFTTLGAGPVVVVTSDRSVDTHPERAARLAAAGARLLPLPDGSTLADGMRALVPLHVQSLLLEGGSAIQTAAWDEGVVDYVQVYIAPAWLGPGAVAWLPGRPWLPASLVEARPAILGPDVLIEGYVHRPH
jgi:diaminohydroxyphosphoribosylaminopyrimidine deaminase / 5-amino-6-(5-phosphoribosylamino)uracil reductase